MTSGDLDLWLLTLKINNWIIWSMCNMLIQFGEYSSKGLSVIEGQIKHDYRGEISFCAPMTLTFDLWPWKSIGFCSGQGYTCWCRLVQISQSVRQLSRRNRTYVYLCVTDGQTIMKAQLEIAVLAKITAKWHCADVQSLYKNQIEWKCLHICQPMHLNSVFEIDQTYIGYREKTVTLCCDVIYHVIDVAMTCIYVIWAKEFESETRFQISWELMKLLAYWLSLGTD